jgi:hypothetical protein
MPMSKTNTNSAFTALAVIAACFAFVSGLRAAQTEQEAASILTTGWWHRDGDKPYHVMLFEPDGTFTFDRIESGSLVNVSAYGGTWQITNGTVLITQRSTGDKETLDLPIDPEGTHGTDNGGGPITMTMKAGDHPKRAAGGLAPSSTLPATPDPQQTASGLIRDYHKSLVFVTGPEGSGSGFIATIGKANYLVTNVHVTAEIPNAEFKTLDGTVIRGGMPSMALGEDIFCMALPPGGKPFEIMQGVDSNAAICDGVAVLGNADGQGVANAILGKIVGIGPNLVEVDAPFVPGNSGSLIIHLKTGKVIGVVTYYVTNDYDLTTNEKLQKPVVRRFGYRLDSVKGWQAVNWRAFEAQATEMQSIDTLTDDLYDFVRDLEDNHGRVTPGRHTNPAIKNRIDDWMAEKGSHPSAEDAAVANANFITYIKDACQSDIATAESQVTYDYFLRDLAEQKGYRDGMEKSFQQYVQGMDQ